MQLDMRAAVSQWTQRVLRLNRSISRSASVDTAASGALIDLSPVGPADEPVDVVAAVLPVARDDSVGDLDPGEPLDALVAVHRRDVEPHGSPVVVRDVVAEHRER